ncbi:MAG: hypothetical protein MI744_13120 [Pseudomonadales bacterium]|nr:hypothetical protein [Pseudomonadales bacterium]
MPLLSLVNTRDIAPFESKEQAVSALMAASAALEKGAPVFASGKTIAVNDNSGVSAKGAAKWIAALGVLVLLVWIVSTMGSGLPRAPMPASLKEDTAAATAETAAQNPFTDAKSVTGKPVSADAFLSR